jgi:hypothetical protein
MSCSARRRSRPGPISQLWAKRSWRGFHGPEDQCGHAGQSGDLV